MAMPEGLNLQANGLLQAPWLIHCVYPALGLQQVSKLLPNDIAKARLQVVTNWQQTPHSVAHMVSRQALLMQLNGSPAGVLVWAASVLTGSRTDSLVQAVSRWHRAPDGQDQGRHTSAR